MDIKKIGLIVNPIAGMGGKTALKGTDGADALSKARARGAIPEASDKALRALRVVARQNANLTVYTCGGPMGEESCQKSGLPYRILYRPGSNSSAEDTVQAARALIDAGVLLILFAGGDGTARDLCAAVGNRAVVLGIPAGVKIQSAVFAVTPEAAGQIACDALQSETIQTALREVVDLDEEQYRCNHISAKLYGCLRVPVGGTKLQNMKVGRIGSDQAMLRGAAQQVISQMHPDGYYAIGPGTTAKSVMETLSLPYELLGVDIIHAQRMVASDVSEQQLWEIALSHPLGLIISPIGGQGFLLGRGNHQFSPRLLERLGKESITVIATQEKLVSLMQSGLRVDSGDIVVDRMLHGYYNVVCGDRYFVSMKCE